MLKALVVGGGPAGLGFLLGARQDDRLRRLLGSGLAIVERSNQLGAGSLGGFAIRSDSFAESFSRAAQADGWPDLRSVLDTPEGRKLAEHHGGPVDLHTAAAFQDRLGAALQDALPPAAVMAGWRATDARFDPGSGWETAIERTDGERRSLRSQFLVLATGAAEDLERQRTAVFGSAPLHPGCAHKLMASGALLGDGGQAAVQHHLKACRQPRIAIAGGSHSALASALQLAEWLGDRLEPGAITILHRRPLKLTYQTPEAARAEGYCDFGDADICRKTGRVLPLGGFRADARDLLRRIWRLGNAEPETRIRLLRSDRTASAEVDATLASADLVVSALGYRPNVLPLHDEAAGSAFRLRVSIGGGPLVDACSRIVAADGRPVPQAFALGLSAGYPLGGRHGEPSFRGEANGLALWQSDIGAEIAQQIMSSPPHGA